MRVARLLLPILTLIALTSPLHAQRRGGGGGGSSHVRGYTRRDGTSAHPYTHSTPRSRRNSAPRAYRAPKQPSYGTHDSRGRIKRSREAREEFMRRTGYPRGRPGYIIDHIVPLCAGGADAPSNMQWQTVEEAKVKDRQERAQCAKGH